MDSRERDREGEPLLQVHTHERHVGDAVDCRRAPGKEIKQPVTCTRQAYVDIIGNNMKWLPELRPT